MEQIPVEAVWIGGGLVVLTGLFYLGIPLLIFQNTQFEADPKIVPFDVSTQKWPKPIERLFNTAREALDEMGFEMMEGIKLPSAASNVRTVAILFLNRETRDYAMATAMHAVPFEPGGLQTLYVEFTCRFRNKVVVNTNNSHQLSGLPSRENVVSNWLPTVTDPADLYEIHLKIADDVQSRSQKILRHEVEFGSDMGAYVQAAISESFEDAARAGWLYLTSDGRYFRPTLKGAYLMTWGELWPMKMFRKGKRNSREREILARFG